MSDFNFRGVSPNVRCQYFNFMLECTKVYSWEINVFTTAVLVLQGNMCRSCNLETTKPQIKIMPISRFKEFLEKFKNQENLYNNIEEKDVLLPQNYKNGTPVSTIGPL